MGTARREQAWLELARGLLECPTAPLREEVPARHVRAFAAARPELFVKSDTGGNLLVGYPRRGASAREPLVVVAHLDHPAFWVRSVSGGRARLDFKGGVRLPHVSKGARVRFFRRGEPQPIGRGALTRFAGVKGRLRSAAARIVSGSAEAGGLAMWDFPGFSIRGGKIVSRGCDDPLGAAAALCMLDELARRRPKGVTAWALFTRAEEAGFLGAMWAVRRRLLPMGARVISLECSRALPNAPQGGGVIVRVGDSLSLFDAPLTEALRQVCAALKKKDQAFRYQRKLMDGGACEATPFCAAGYRASALALPLGNYHNQKGLDRGPRAIGAESVAVGDFLTEVKLLVALALAGRGLAKLEGATRARMAACARRASKEIPAHPLAT